MAHINIVILAGNLTRDPELRFTPRGMGVAEFGLAINRKWKNEAGELQEECSFFDCVAFGKTADMIAQYFKKGNPIMIEGRLKQEQWEDKQTGRPRSKVKVILERFHFTAVKAQEGEERAPKPGRPPPAVPAAAGEVAGATEDDDDDRIPF